MYLCMYTHMHTRTSIVYPLRTCVCIRKYIHCMHTHPLPLPSLSLPQVAAIFVLALYFCLYSYLKPYKMITDNLFELLLLANFFTLMMLRSVVFVRDVLSDVVVSPDPTDCTEWTVVKPSDFAVTLGVLYYVPVIYAAMPITLAILRYYWYVHMHTSVFGINA